jgi:hypothetical protein
MVHLHFLAASTFFRTAWSWNEDVYLADADSARSHEAIPVRLVDSYPNGGPSLSRKVLT